MTAQVTWPYPCPQPHEHDLVRVLSRIADSYLPILRGGKAQNGRIGLKKRRNWRHFAGCCHDPLRLRGGGEGATKVLSCHRHETIRSSDAASAKVYRGHDPGKVRAEQVSAVALRNYMSRYLLCCFWSSSINFFDCCSVAFVSSAIAFRSSLTSSRDSPNVTVDCAPLKGNSCLSNAARCASSNSNRARSSITSIAHSRRGVVSGVGVERNMPTLNSIILASRSPR